ncbi:MAG: 2-oxo acid dehydrogenase subunit E2, partial [Acidocella sp.]|nr:2-oxo acid dehydrogenase subunit E2 [Acidocella sp.]
MAINILMPALSPTMTEGTLARWLKREGEAVAAGDVIAEIETDKATMEVEAVDEGVLGTILVPAGTASVAVNTPIAVLVEPGGAATLPPPAQPTPAPPAPNAMPAVTAQPVMQAAVADTGQNSARILASPLARRLAHLRGIDLAGVAGSGPNGRIVRADIDAAIAPGPAAAATVAPPQPAAATAVAITAPHRLVPHSSMRRVIARRLTEAKQTVPHFYLTVDIGLDKLLALRAELNARSPAEGQGGFKLSVNDFVIKAVALALHRVPGANASYTEAGTVLYDD